MGFLSPPMQDIIAQSCSIQTITAEEKDIKQSPLHVLPCIVLVTPLGGNPEPALFTSSLPLSHTLPPTAGLITGIGEGAVCSLLSS